MARGRKVAAGSIRIDNADLERAIEQMRRADTSKRVTVRLAVDATGNRSAKANMLVWALNARQGRNPFVLDGLGPQVQDVLSHAVGEHLRGAAGALAAAGKRVGEILYAEVMRLIDSTPIERGNYTSDDYLRWKRTHSKKILEKTGELIKSLRAVFDVR